MTRQEFITKYSQAAQRAAAGSKIFPGTILAAASLESGNARSLLTSKYNNFFGIKASPSWTGKVIDLPTTEYVNGKAIKISQPFRHYNSPEESFKDYVRLLSTNRYVKAGVTSAKTPKEQFDAIQKAGYATDPNYSKKLSGVYDAVLAFAKTNPATSSALGLIVVVCVILLIFQTY